MTYKFTILHEDEYYSISTDRLGNVTSVTRYYDTRMTCGVALRLSEIPVAVNKQVQKRVAKLNQI